MDNPVKNQTSLQNESIEAYNNTQDDLLKIRKFNTNIRNLDPMYANLKPTSAVIIRMFLLEPEVKLNGLLVARKQMVPIATQSGNGNLYEIESPFPYSQKAIVIATPRNTSLQPGMIIQVGGAMVKAMPDGKGKNGHIIIPNSYIHPDTNVYVAPTDMASPHYGYLIIPPHEVIVILEDAPAQ